MGHAAGEFDQRAVSEGFVSGDSGVNFGGEFNSDRRERAELAGTGDKVVVIV